MPRAITNSPIRSGGPNVPALEPARPAGAARPRLPEWVFLAYLLLLLVEYIGLAALVPPLKAIRFSTLLAYFLLGIAVLRCGLTSVFREAQGRLLLVFLVFTAASMAWAVVTTYAFNSIRPLLDYLGLFVVTAAVMDRPARIKRLCVVSALIVVVLVARNMDKLTATVRQGAFRSGYFLGDGNDFAWGLAIFLPMFFYLVVERHSILLRLLGVIGGLTALFGIIGTQSRGGTLAVGASVLYYICFVSKRRVIGIALLVVIAAGAVFMAPSTYVDRMRSVGEFEADNSARSRLQAWGAAVRMALDYPLGVGAGNFNSAYGRFYIPDAEHSQIVWASGRWISAHSVYFKALGEYGFPGLCLLLGILYTNLRQNLATRRRLLAAAVPGVSPLWPAIVNVSIVAYAVAGTFLGGIAYPHIYLLSGLTIAAKKMAVDLADQSAATAASASAAAETPAQPRLSVADRFRPAARTARPPQVATSAHARRRSGR